MATPSIVVHTGRLSPLCIGTVSQVQNGTDQLQQIELIQLNQNPYALGNPANALPVAAAIITPTQVGTSSRPDIQRVTLNPLPYDGTFNLVIGGTTYWQIPYNATAAELQATIGSAYVVTKKGNSDWQIATVALADLGAITYDVTQLVVPVGVQGELSLNQMGIWLAFVAAAANVLKFTFEVQIVWPGEDPQTVFQDTVSVSRNVINLNTLVSATLLGLQTSYSALVSGVGFTYSNSITGLTGGGTNLDAVTTAEKTLGYRYDFWLNNQLNSFFRVSGAADGADPTGQVPPLDYDAGTNNVHWQRGA